MDNELVLRTAKVMGYKILEPDEGHPDHRLLDTPDGYLIKLKNYPESRPDLREFELCNTIRWHMQHTYGISL